LPGPDRPIVFFDRDGTLNADLGFVWRPEDVTLLPGVPEALRRLRPHYALVVVTNQSGMARGLYGHEDVAAVHARLVELLAANGAALDRIEYCPHGPDDGCDCRKPAIGMLERAARALGLSLANAWMVGDRSSDIEAGLNVGARTVLLPEAVDAPPLRVTPHFHARDLAEAAQLILREDGRT